MSQEISIAASSVLSEVTRLPETHRRNKQPLFSCLSPHLSDNTLYVCPLHHNRTHDARSWSNSIIAFVGFRLVLVRVAQSCSAEPGIVTRTSGTIEHQMFLMPASLLHWLPGDHMVHVLRGVLEIIDLSVITSSHEAEGRGFPPYHPWVMTGILLYGYCRGMTSPR